MALIPKPKFPNVPKLPGVPQLQRASNAISPAFPVLLGAIAIGRLWQAVTGARTWGIFKQAKPPTPGSGVGDNIPTVTVAAQNPPVVTPDSVLDFGYRNEYDILDYPVQEGAFQSVNKVANPYEATVRMSKGGSKSDRAAFLKQMEDILPTTSLYTILTPEKTYVNVNPIRLELSRRGAGGAYFLTEVDLTFREIRSTTAQYTTTAVLTGNAQDPSALPVKNDGTVNGEVVTDDANIEKIIAAVQALPPGPNL